MTLVTLKTEMEWLSIHERKLKQRLRIVTYQMVLQKGIGFFYKRNCRKEQCPEIIDLKKSLNTIYLELDFLNQLVHKLYEGWIREQVLEQQIYVEKYFYHWSNLKIYIVHRSVPYKEIRKLLQTIQKNMK